MCYWDGSLKEEVEKWSMRNETLMLVWTIWKLKDRGAYKGVENSFVKIGELLCFMHTFRAHMGVQSILMAGCSS